MKYDSVLIIFYIFYSCLAFPAGLAYFSTVALHIDMKVISTVASQSWLFHLRYTLCIVSFSFDDSYFFLIPNLALFQCASILLIWEVQC